MKKLIILILLILIPLYAQAQDQTARLVLGAVGADVTAPTLSTATIAANGETWTFAMSESIVCSPTTDCCDAWTVTMSTAGAITFNYVSGSGASNIVCTGSPVVLSGETVSAGLDYTQPGNGIEDVVGNDLATIDDHAVVNNSTVTTCNPATDEVGDRTDYASGFDIPSNTVYCLLYTPDCIGVLGYAYAKHGGTGPDNAKMGVFLDDGDSVPGNGDTLVGTWQALSSSAVEWTATASKLTGSVDTGHNYFVCIYADTTNFSILRTTTGARTSYYVTGLDYSTPPTDLYWGFTWTPIASRDYSLYVGIE